MYLYLVYVKVVDIQTSFAAGQKEIVKTHYS